MTNFNDYLAKQMEDAAFKEAYDALEPEFAIMQAMIDENITATGDCHEQNAEG